MTLPTSPFLSVLAVYPVLQDEIFDPTKPSPWAGVRVPSTPDPLKPAISILFSHGLTASAVADDASLSTFFFLTSISDPSAPNITAFEALVWDSQTNLLTFRPAAPLIPGDSYQATIRSTLRDTAGRKFKNAYSWEFEIDPSLYQGIPVPVTISPEDQTAVQRSFFPLSWSQTASYTSIPTGQFLYFQTQIFSDANLTHSVWTGEVAASSSLSTDSNSTFNIYSQTPSFVLDPIETPASYWWRVRAILKDGAGTQVAASSYSPASQFYYAPTDTSSVPGGFPSDTYPGLLELNRLVPPRTFVVSGILPQPGYVAPIKPSLGSQTDFY